MSTNISVKVGPAQRIKNVKVSLYVSFARYDELGVNSLKAFLKEHGERNLYDSKTKYWEVPYELLEELFEMITSLEVL